MVRGQVIEVLINEQRIVRHLLMNQHKMRFKQMEIITYTPGDQFGCFMCKTHVLFYVFCS